MVQGERTEDLRDVNVRSSVVFNDRKSCTKNVWRNMSLSVWSLFSFLPFKVEGKNEFELCQLRTLHYHLVTANVHGKDLYGQTNLKYGRR